MESNTKFENEIDKFSKNFFYFVPISVPIIVFLGTFLFYNCCYENIWLPLLIIYEITIWTYTLIYHFKRGGVFTKEKFKFTLLLKGDKVWLQYILVYGPLVFSIPGFFIEYSSKLSLNMFLALMLASIINGPSEEIFWRACLDEVGKNIGYTEKKRLLIAPILFAFWHTAFVYHLYPHDNTWIFGWLGIIATTWLNGMIWLWALHKSRRIVPQCIEHSCANFFSVFPMILISILNINF